MTSTILILSVTALFYLYSICSLFLFFVSQFFPATTKYNDNNNSNNNLQDLQPLDVCGMERAGSVAKLMACAILNDCMVCPAQENEAVALSNERI